MGTFALMYFILQCCMLWFLCYPVLLVTCWMLPPYIRFTVMRWDENVQYVFVIPMN